MSLVFLLLVCSFWSQCESLRILRTRTLISARRTSKFQYILYATDTDGSANKKTRFGSEFEREDILIPPSLTNKISNSSASPYQSTKYWVSNETNALETEFNDIDGLLTVALLEHGCDNDSTQSVMKNLDIEQKAALLRALRPKRDEIDPVIAQYLSASREEHPELSDNDLKKIVDEAMDAARSKFVDDVVDQAKLADTYAKLVDIYAAAQNDRDFFVNVVKWDTFQSKIQEWLKVEDDDNKPLIIDNRILNETLCQINAKYLTASSDDLFLGWLPTAAIVLNSFDRVMDEEVKGGDHVAFCCTAQNECNVVTFFC